MLVESAGGPLGARHSDAMQTLMLRYLPALKIHLICRWRVSVEQAEDWLQEFLSVKVVEQRLIGQASKEKGRFRNFLRATLDAFVISQMRRENARKRRARHITDLDAAEREPHACGPEPTDAFDMAWAREVISQAVDQMRAECEKSNRCDLWGLFQTRVLGPIADGTPVPPYQELVERFGYRSPLQAANALVTAKRMFQRNLRAVLAEYVEEEAEIDNEISELQSILAGGRS